MVIKVSKAHFTNSQNAWHVLRCSALNLNYVRTCLTRTTKLWKFSEFCRREKKGRPVRKNS